MKITDEASMKFAKVVIYSFVSTILLFSFIFLSRVYGDAFAFTFYLIGVSIVSFEIGIVIRDRFT